MSGSASPIAAISQQQESRPSGTPGEVLLSVKEGLEWSERGDRETGPRSSLHNPCQGSGVFRTEASRFTPAPLPEISAQSSCKKTQVSLSKAGDRETRPRSTFIDPCQASGVFRTEAVRFPGTRAQNSRPYDL